MSNSFHTGRKRSLGAGHSNRSASIASALRFVVDGCFTAIIIVAPLFMAGREPLGQLVLVSLAALLAVVWAASQLFVARPHCRISGVEPVLLAGVLLIVLQTVSLPESWRETISPNLKTFLPQWTASAEWSQAGTEWTHLSFTPAYTTSNLSVILAVLLILIVAIQRWRNEQDFTRLLQLVSLGGGLMAVFALAQFVGGNGRFFWMYDHPYTDTSTVVKGAFTNPNHAGHFFTLAIPAQLWLFLRALQASSSQKKRRSSLEGWPGRSNGAPWDSVSFQKAVWGICLCATLVAMPLTLSRAAILGGTVALTGSVILAWRQSLLSAKAMCGIVLFGLSAMSIPLMLGDRIIKHFENNVNELATADMDVLDQEAARRRIWMANIDGFQTFPILGTGLGSHRDVYHIWFDGVRSGSEYSHAENGYLQVALETGSCGLVIVGLLWLWVGLHAAVTLWRVQDPVRRGAVGVACIGLVTNLIHSLFDFVWYVPACMIIVLLYAATVLNGPRRAEPDASTSSPFPGTWGPRVCWALTIPAVVAIATWSIQVKAPEVAAAKDWNHYLRISFDLQKPSSRDPETEAFHREQRTLAVLRAVEKNPNDHRVQLRAAIAHLRLFSKYQLESGSGMSLMQIRDAVRASQFPTHEAMNEWLNKPGVLGESRQHLIDAATHLRMSLQLCPAQSRSYLELADLLWLEGIDDANELHLVEQAAILRPHDARVRFILGRDAWLSGRYEEALEHWQESFRQDSTYRDTLITSLSRFVPATFFLENFDVDRAALTKLREAYKESEDRAAYTKILKKLARACVVDAIQKEGMSAVRDWITASDRFLEAGETMYSFRCAQESHRLNPSSYDARWRLGHLYLKQEKFDLAAEHLLWCFQQKPDDPTTKRWAERAIALAQQKSSSAVTPVHALDTTPR